ncbi:hypothetical protein BH11BAC5_BH11BAC5_45370 [soil metagenome]
MFEFRNRWFELRYAANPTNNQQHLLKPDGTNMIVINSFQ